MSESDSFINEVTEEVQRDRLYGYLRRYGWIAVLAVLVLVGGAAVNEYRKAQAEADAQALGDAMFAALETDDAAGRAGALSGLGAESEAAVIAALLEAGELQAAGQTAAAADRLEAVANAATTPPLYPDVALLKSLMLRAPDMDPGALKDALGPLAQPGAPFRLLAAEQIVYADLAAGETEAAMAGLDAILDDAELRPGLRERAQNLMVALGGEIGAESDALLPGAGQ